MPRVSEEHRQERRRQITGAALRCVLREGFHKTTMADIIGEAGLSAGAVYGYFASKTDIIRALVELSVGAVIDGLNDDVEGADGPDLADALDQALDGILALAKLPEGDLTLVGIQAWSEAIRDPEVKAVVAPRLRELRALFRRIAERQIARGELPADADAEQTARVVVSLLPGFVLQRAMLGGMDRRKYVAAFRALLAGPAAPTTASG